MGGRTIFLSRLLITILHSCFNNRLSTDLSQFSAYIDKEPSSRSITGARMLSAAEAT
jgi:hypothetical protein